MSDALEDQREDNLRTIQAMLRYGGAFVKALAGAAQLADSENLAKIKATWPEYWSHYSSMQARITSASAHLGPALKLIAVCGRLCVPVESLTAEGCEHFHNMPAALADLRWPEDRGKRGEVQMAVQEMKRNGHLRDNVSMVVSPDGGYLPV